MNAVKELKSIRKSVEEIKNDKLQRFPEAASDGDTFRQGDVYITFRESLPAGWVAVEKPNAQLAPGTTQGSRHILDSLDGVKQFARSRPTGLQGPVLVLEKERIVTHPEHGDVSLPPGCYAITYQRAFAQELRRVAD